MDRFRLLKCRRLFVAALLMVGILGLGMVSGSVDAQVPFGQPLVAPPPPGGGFPFPEFVMFGAGSLQGFAGLATILNGVPVILYDPAWLNLMGGTGSAGFRFTRAHEYGHHRLGHIMAQFTTPPALLPTLGYQSELGADCWAVRTLASIGDPDAVNAGFAIYQQVLPPQDVQGRPGAFNRIQNMRICLSN